MRITHLLTDVLITHHACGQMYFILIVLDPFKPRSSRAGQMVVLSISSVFFIYHEADVGGPRKERSKSENNPFVD